MFRRGQKSWCCCQGIKNVCKKCFGGLAKDSWDSGCQVVVGHRTERGSELGDFLMRMGWGFFFKVRKWFGIEELLEISAGIELQCLKFYRLLTVFYILKDLTNF